MEMPSVLDAAQRIRDGSLRAVDLIERSIEAIEEQNEALNAFVYLDHDGAMRAAHAVDSLVARGAIDELGPLAGVPFGVKDLENCAGMPTTKGSRWHAADGPAPRDAIHVGRLRAAGAIPLGKTATPEFGAWAYTASPLLGVTRNPWDRSRTPGGSSGGSSAAVSAGMVPFATASDGGGSIRTPASFTGLVGLRACYGRIPTLGDTHLAQNAVVGALTTTVADTAALLDVMAGPDARDRTCLPAPPAAYTATLRDDEPTPLRIGFSADLGFALVEPAVVACAHAAAERFAEANGTELLHPELRLEDYTAIYTQIEGVDRFVGVDPSLWTERLGELDPASAASWPFFAARTLPAAARTEARRRTLVQQVATAFDDLDLLLTPMASVLPFDAEGPMPTKVDGTETHAGMSVVLGFLASLVNLPALSVPAGLSADGLPIGLQVIGPRFDESLVLRTAGRYERVSPWPRHAVPTS